jgi:metallo-beta-lactamase class B
VTCSEEVDVGLSIRAAVNGLLLAAFVGDAGTIDAQSVLPPAAALHVEAARAAAGKDFPRLFDSLCGNVGKATPANAAGAIRRDGPPPARTIPDRKVWYREPAKVFDNLYMLAMNNVALDDTAWAVTTSQGIILIDALYDYSVKESIADNLRKLGLNPAEIKYAIISHGHGDHSAGAKFLQDEFGTRVMLSGSDWDLLDLRDGEYTPTPGPNQTPRPKRELVAADGQTLTLGDTTITMYVTPGHTSGTLSFLIPVRDQGRRHVAAMFGGTLFNFPWVDPERFGVYAQSAERFGALARAAGADVIIANHDPYYEGFARVAALAAKPASHPFVVGVDGVTRYMKVAESCARAMMLSVR